MRITLLIITALALSLSSCKKCKHENPRAQIINNGTTVVSVHIETSGGNTVNINNIYPGDISSYAYYEEGTVSFTVSIGNGNNTTTEYITVGMSECYEYDIIINANNQLISVPRDRNE